jgi:hypothetical protein
MSGKPSSPAAFRAIEHGLTGLAEMANLSGTPRRSLEDWFRTRSVLFEVVAAGCAVKKGKESIQWTQ